MPVAVTVEKPPSTARRNAVAGKRIVIGMIHVSLQSRPQPIDPVGKQSTNQDNTLTLIEFNLIDSRSCLGG